MTQKTLVIILTAASGLLCLMAAVSCIWFLEHFAYLSAFLEFVAFIITLVGAVYGAFWLKEKRQEHAE